MVSFILTNLQIMIKNNNLYKYIFLLENMNRWLSFSNIPKFGLVVATIKYP